MEDKAHSYLTDWIINYLKNRDIMFRKIEEVKKNKAGFDAYVKFKDREQFILVRPVIDVDELFNGVDEGKHLLIVVLNTISNFQMLLKNWDKFTRFKHLSVYFVNPFSKLDKKWVIHPYTHNNICEQNALEKGLKAMFEMVEPLKEENIRDTF